MKLGVNTGRALMAIGDDVAQMSREASQAALQERLARMRDDRERELGELKAWLTQVRGSGASRAAGSRSAAGPVDYTPRQQAALAGMTDAELEEASFVQAAGGEREVKATAADDGMAYLAPEDRQQLESAGAMRGDTPATIRGKRNLPSFRAALVSTSVDPKEIDDLATGFETVRLQQDPSVTPEDRAKRIASLSGKPMREIRGDTVFDPFEAPTGTTDRGEAKTKAELARAGRPATSGRSAAPNDLRDANTAAETARRALKDAERTALDLLTRNNPAALSWDADRREQWLRSQPRVQAAESALVEAEAYRRRFMAPPPGGAATLPSGVSRDEAVRQARAAIARGANRDAVLQRLRQFGIDEAL